MSATSPNFLPPAKREMMTEVPKKRMRVNFKQPIHITNMKPDSKPWKTGKPLQWLVGGMMLLALSTTAHGWAPNARDRADAMNAGDFTAYSDRLAEWLNQQVSADPPRITKETMMALAERYVHLPARDLTLILFTSGGPSAGLLLRSSVFTS